MEYLALAFLCFIGFRLQRHWAKKIEAPLASEKFYNVNHIHRGIVPRDRIPKQIGEIVVNINCQLDDKTNLLIGECVIERASQNPLQLAFVNEVIRQLKFNLKSFLKMGAWRVIYARGEFGSRIKFVSGSKETVDMRCWYNFDEVSQFIDFALFNYTGVDPANLILTNYYDGIWQSEEKTGER